MSPAGPTVRFPGRRGRRAVPGTGTAADVRFVLGAGIRPGRSNAQEPISPTSTRGAGPTGGSSWASAQMLVDRLEGLPIRGHPRMQMARVGAGAGGPRTGPGNGSPARYSSGSANATRRASGPAPVAIRMNWRPARER